MTETIPVDQVLHTILSGIEPLGLEKVPLLETLGKVIGEDVYAGRDIPPFDNSGMDGFAVRWEDIQSARPDQPVRLDVVEVIPAGSLPQKRLRKGQAAQIMTGAPISEGADAVIPLEKVVTEGDHLFISETILRGKNIRREGEDVKKGDRVLSIGDLIRPAEVGMLASLGRSFILTYQRPRVGILCNGDELVDIDQEVKGARIISSNSYTLAAQVKECGAIPVYLGIAKDNKKDIFNKLGQGSRLDLLVSSAGISVGDYDLAREVFLGLGGKTFSWKVAMKPGKPLVFGKIEEKPVFGLPGNPVATMISFEQFVRPTLLKMMGHRHLFRPVIEAILKEPLQKEAGIRYYLRASVSFEEGCSFVTIVKPQGSGVLRSMMMANGLVVLPEEKEAFAAGEKVNVQLFDRSVEV